MIIDPNANPNPTRRRITIAEALNRLAEELAELSEIRCRPLICEISTADQAVLEKLNARLERTVKRLEKLDAKTH